MDVSGWARAGMTDGKHRREAREREYGLAGRSSQKSKNADKKKGGKGGTGGEREKEREKKEKIRKRVRDEKIKKAKQQKEKIVSIPQDGTMSRAIVFYLTKQDTVWHQKGDNWTQIWTLRVFRPMWIFDLWISEYWISVVDGDVTQRYGRYYWYRC